MPLLKRNEMIEKVIENSINYTNEDNLHHKVIELYDYEDPTFNEIIPYNELNEQKIKRFHDTIICGIYICVLGSLLIIAVVILFFYSFVNK
jgi:hypothetical protein